MWPFRKKRRMPDLGVVIEYFKAEGKIFVWAQPGDLDKDTLLFILNTATQTVMGTNIIPVEDENMVHKIVSELRDHKPRLRLVRK